MLEEIARLTFAWGTMGVVIAFWYWIMKNLGTF